MNFKQLFVLTTALTLTIAPMQASIDTRHAALGTAIIATGTMTLFADAYLKDCKNLQKEPSMREFGSYVFKFSKNLISNKEIRSAAMTEHTLLLAAIAAAIGAGVLTVGTAAYNKLYSKIQNPPTPPAQPLTPEEEKAKAKADETASELAAITTLEELSLPTAKTKEERQEAYKAYKALTPEKQKENNEARDKARTEQAQKAKAEQEKQEQERANRAKVDEKSVTCSDAILKEKAQQIRAKRTEALEQETSDQKKARKDDEKAIIEKELKAKEEKAKEAALTKSKQEKANTAHQKAQEEKEADAKINLIVTKIEKFNDNVIFSAVSKECLAEQEKEYLADQEKEYLADQEYASKQYDKHLSQDEKNQLNALSWLSINWFRNCRNKFLEITQKKEKKEALTQKDQKLYAILLKVLR